MSNLLNHWRASHTWQVVLFFLAGGLIGASQSTAFAAYKPILVAIAGFLTSGAVGVGLLSSSASAVVNEKAVAEFAAKKPVAPKVPLPVLLGVFVVLGLGSCTPSLKATITSDVVGEVHCVEAQLLAGNDTFEGIGLVCGIALVEDVIAIVSGEMNSAPDSATAPYALLATAASKIHHKPEAGQ